MVSTRVLVVEDDAGMAEVLRVNLESAGYQVLAAADGLEALHIFDHERLDIAMVDLGIPSISGFRLVELLKRRLPPGPLPVIVVTGLSFEEAQDAVSAGADDFISKPFDPTDLVRRVGSVLARREDTGTARPQSSRPQANG